MTVIVALAPLLAVIALLASRRVSLLYAGCAGLAVSLAASMVIAGSWAAGPAILGHALAHGGWLAWHVIAIIVGGLALYQVLARSRPDLFEPVARPGASLPHSALFTICFLLGPFAESATGFGVGYLITVSLLLRLGMPGLTAAAFGVFSQILVPWGALGIGTVIGAELIAMPVNTLGKGSALLSIPLLGAYLVVFWWMCRRHHTTPSLRDMGADLLWTVVLLALLYGASSHLDLEVGVLAATGPLLVLRWWCFERRAARPRTVLASALPYIALTVILLATRSIPSLQTLLENTAAITPSAGWPPFAPLYHPSFWLAAVAVGYALWQLPRSEYPAVRKAVFDHARVPALVSLVFMVMADIMAVSGIPALLATAWVGMFEHLAVVVTPLLGMLAGALTGSNAASNALLMALQVELANAAGVDADVMAAVQNVAGSNATLFSPARIAMGAALAGVIGREAALYARIWPLIAAMTIVLVAASLLA